MYPYYLNSPPQTPNHTINCNVGEIFLNANWPPNCIHFVQHALQNAYTIRNPNRIIRRKWNLLTFDALHNTKFPEPTVWHICCIHLQTYTQAHMYTAQNAARNRKWKYCCDCRYIDCAKQKPHSEATTRSNMCVCALLTPQHMHGNECMGIF